MGSNKSHKTLICPCQTTFHDRIFWNYVCDTIFFTLGKYTSSQAHIRYYEVPFSMNSYIEKLDCNYKTENSVSELFIVSAQEHTAHHSLCCGSNSGINMVTRLFFSYIVQGELSSLPWVLYFRSYVVLNHLHCTFRYIVSYIPGGKTGMSFFTKIFYLAASKTVSKTLPVWLLDFMKNTVLWIVYIYVHI